MRALGPLPITTSNRKSSIAGYRPSSTTRGKPVHLVDEQHVAVVEVGEDRREVAGPFERGSARRRDARAHLVGDDAAEARLAEAGRAREQHVVDGLAALLRRGEHDLEVLAQARLADELVEPARPQRRLLRGLDRIGDRARAALLSSVHLTCRRRGGAARCAGAPRRCRRRGAGRAPRAPRRASSRGSSSASRTSARALDAVEPGIAVRSRSGTSRRALRSTSRRCAVRLPDAGHEHERVEVVLGEAAAQRGRRVHRQDRERELRARHRSPRSAPRTCRARRASGSRRGSSRRRARAGA